MFNNIFEGTNFNNFINNERTKKQIENLSSISKKSLMYKAELLYNNYKDYLEQWYSKESFIENILNTYNNLNNKNIKDFIFNLYFSNPVSKQGFDENFQISYLKNELEKYGIKIKKLPVGGISALYCNKNGNISNNKENIGKSLDIEFKYQYKSYILYGYGTLKYAKGLYGAIKQIN